MGEGWKDFEEHNRGNLSCLEQTSSRNLDLADATWEGPKGSEKHAIRNWKNSCYVLAGKLSSALTWEAEKIPMNL